MQETLTPVGWGAGDARELQIHVNDAGPGHLVFRTDRTHTHRTNGGG